MKNINFVPEESKEFYHHIKILKSIMNRDEVFYLKILNILDRTLRPYSLYFSEFLCDDRILSILWVQNWYFSHFLCHSFVFLNNSSVRIGSSLSFCIYLVFIPKFLLSVTFARNGGSFTILIDLLKFRINSKKNVNMSFLNITLCYHLSLEAFLQVMAKNNPTEKQIEAKILKQH